MPVDASLYSQFAPRVRSPEDVQNGLMQNAQAGMQMQNGLLDMQQKRDAIAQDNAMRQAVSESGGDPARLRDALIARGLVKPLMEHDKTQALIGKDNAAAAKDNAKAGTEALAQARSMLPMVQTPEQFGQWVDGLYTNPATANVAKQFGTPEQVKSRIPANPADFQKFLQMNAMGMDKFIADQTSRANNKATNDTHIATNAATNQTHIQTTQMTNATSRANNAATQAGEDRRSGNTIANQRLMAGMNSDGSLKIASGPDGQIDLKTVAPEDLAAAYRYKTDGTFPPNMGRGVQGAAEGRKIRAIASALDAQAGETPEDARVRQLAAKGDVAAINKMRQREVAVGANVKNFDFNADQVLQLSNKVDRSGVPIANAWINAGRRSVTGNADLSAFDTAIKTTVNEFAQIVSGTTSGATAEGEKKKAEALLNAQQTPEQIIATVNQMRIESQNRMRSFKAQRAESMPTNAPRQPEAAPSTPKVVKFGDLK